MRRWIPVKKIHIKGLRTVYRDFKLQCSCSNFSDKHRSNNCIHANHLVFQNVTATFVALNASVTQLSKLWTASYYVVCVYTDSVLWTHRRQQNMNISDMSRLWWYHLHSKLNIFLPLRNQHKCKNNQYILVNIRMLLCLIKQLSY